MDVPIQSSGDGGAHNIVHIHTTCKGLINVTTMFVYVINGHASAMSVPVAK